jgi:hypothetical protein
VPAVTVTGTLPAVALLRRVGHRQRGRALRPAAGSDQEPAIPDTVRGEHWRCAAKISSRRRRIAIEAPPHALSSLHHDGDAAHGRRHFSADLGAAELQNNAVGILQLDAAGAGRDRATCTACDIAACKIAGAAQV